MFFSVLQGYFLICFCCLQHDYFVSFSSFQIFLAIFLTFQFFFQFLEISILIFISTMLDCSEVQCSPIECNALQCDVLVNLSNFYKCISLTLGMFSLKLNYGSYHILGWKSCSKPFRIHHFQKIYSSRVLQIVLGKNNIK